MSWLDIIRMAIHNLRRRPFRTILNLLGIVLGTVMVLMTMAGSEGVKHALHSVLESSDFTRKVIARRTSKVSEEDLDQSRWKISQPMSAARRERMEESLKKFLLEEKRKTDGRYRQINQETLKQFGELHNVIEVVPQLRVNFKLSMGEFDQTIYGEGVSPKVSGLNERIVSGEMLTASDRNGILIHELMAYRMGCVTQQELDALVGTEVVCSFKTSGKPNQLASALTAIEGGDLQKLVSQNPLILGFIKQLGGNVDNLRSLTDEQKQLLRKSIGSLGESDSPQPPVVERRFKIKGVYHSIAEDNLFDLFSQLRFDSKRPVLFHYETATDLQVDVGGIKEFYSATLHVDRFAHVKQVEDDLGELGYDTFSARAMIERIDNRISRISRVIYVVALIILVVTGIAISNTLIISVMERTSEFGIMKSLGARDNQIVGLMFVEGALLGAVGAVLATLASLLIGMFGQSLVRDYVEGRVNEQVSGEMFMFSPWATLVALMVSVLLCAVASVIPAWRAARLDPIVAMRKN